MPAYPAPMILYGPDEPRGVEGVAVESLDDRIQLILPIAEPPAEGTTV